MKDRLRELRKEKGVTQKVVADAIGVTESAYSNYEQGLREPSVMIIIALCRYYDVSADYLLGINSEY
ncbi:MAG: helix-turn-helix transcriptional regulator [Clostridiales bacterium]|nr:helix-turn-helix transcriptional regulator [Clostridiales bacterium]